MFLSKIFSYVKYIVKYILYSCGVLFITLVVLSFTDIPFNAYFWLGTHNSTLKKKPDYIVLLGAGGMPSPESFMRIFYATEFARQYPKSHIVLAMPSPDSVLTKGSAVGKMYDELIFRGVDSCRIIIESEGINTYEQVRNTVSLLDGALDTVSLCVVTSPEHMYRSVMAFNKHGIEYVGGRPAFERVEDEEVFLRRTKLKSKNTEQDKEIMNLSLRYNMWNYMKYEILIIREFCAIAYYKINGWI